MITNRDIIIVGQQAWDVEIGSNCKDIAYEFSKSNRVLYVNSPLDRITKIRNFKSPKIKHRINIIQQKDNGLIQIQENLWVYYPDILIESINWIRIHKLFLFLNKRNNKLFASSIQKPIKQLGLENYIIFNDNDIFRSFHLKELLNPDLSIYYSRDYIIATDYWRRHGKYLEPLLIAKSDICFSNSEFLRNYCRKYNKNSYYVGQGCDLELFKTNTSFPIPKQVKDIKFPIIGYIGTLTSSRLDIDLIEYLAKSSPNWNIVLVGPTDDCFKNSILHDFKNVYFLGSQKLEELPYYINSFDVCINPQIINKLTIGNYPRKIDEYLALGKPVVATRTETMLVFKKYVYLATDKIEFVELVKKALKKNDSKLSQKRKEFALSHSWHNSVSAIFTYIKKYYTNRR